MWLNTMAPADKESVQVLFRLMLLHQATGPFAAGWLLLESTMVIQSVLGQAGARTFGLDSGFTDA